MDNHDANLAGEIAPTDVARRFRTAVKRSSRDAGEPVRVCFLIDRLDRAGTESQLLMLIRHLNRTRVKPYLCLLDGEDDRSRSLEPDCCPVLRLGVRSLHKPKTVAGAVRFARFLRRERIDVLQVYFRDSTCFGVPVGKLAGVPLIVRTRNNLGYWMTPLDRWLGRFLNRLTDATLANCEPCRQAVIADESASPATVLVFENAVELRNDAGQSPSESSREGSPVLRIGMVANLRSPKNPQMLVRAAAIVARAHPDVVFEIAGDGPLRDAVSRLVESSGLNPRFHLHGSISDVPAFLSRLDVAVLTSQSEGMSNALMEYMAAGLPIVATSVGHNPELIKDGVHGLLVPSDDHRALADAIVRLLSDRAFAGRLAAAARRRITERYSAESRARRFERICRGLLENRIGASRAAGPPARGRSAGECA